MNISRLNIYRNDISRLIFLDRIFLDWIFLVWIFLDYIFLEWIFLDRKWFIPAVVGAPVTFFSPIIHPPGTVFILNWGFYLKVTCEFLQMGKQRNLMILVIVNWASNLSKWVGRTCNRFYWWRVTQNYDCSLFNLKLRLESL